MDFDLIVDRLDRIEKRLTLIDVGLADLGLAARLDRIDAALTTLAERIAETAEIAAVFNRFGAMVDNGQAAGVQVLQKPHPERG